MKSEFDAFRANRTNGGDQAPRQGQGSACAVTTTLSTLPAAINDRQVLNYNHYDTPCYNDDLCERSGCYGVSAATIEVDLIFDNATDVSVIGDERLALDLEPTQAKLIGFNGARSDAVAIATLPGRLGKALYVPGAQNLLGSQSLADMGYRDQHRIPDSEGAWEIVHDDGGFYNLTLSITIKRRILNYHWRNITLLLSTDSCSRSLLTVPKWTICQLPSSANSNSPVTSTPASIILARPQL